MKPFPQTLAFGESGGWHCPAFGCVIAEGLCYECAFADRFGPTDTADELRRWVAKSGKFGSVAEFQAVCATCPHCPWEPPKAEVASGCVR